MAVGCLCIENIKQLQAAGITRILQLSSFCPGRGYGLSGQAVRSVRACRRYGPPSITSRFTPASRPLLQLQLPSVPEQNKIVMKWPRAQSTYFTVRGQSYFSRLPKYWPPIPLSARWVCTPCLCCGGRTDLPGGEGDGGSIFWKTREIGLPSYSKICTLWPRAIHPKCCRVSW